MHHGKQIGPTIVAQRTAPGGAPMIWAGGRRRRRAEDSASAVVDLPLDSVVLGDGPRLDGEDLDHTRRLVEADDELPPILVHARTRRVIDGLHRVRAAMLRGDRTIRAELFDGDDDAAFVVSVARNVTHGLPLSTRDRHAATERIIATHPEWSDRRIARVTGLSARTVAAVRCRSTAHVPQSNGRVGQDGRIRPLDGPRRRAHAARLMAERPDASLREIAEAAGISVSTAHDVRQRLGETPDPSPKDIQAMLTCLSQDPTIRMNETGRFVYRWLSAHAIYHHKWQPILDSVPAHQLTTVAALARKLAANWSELADQLEERREGEQP